MFQPVTYYKKFSLEDGQDIEYKMLAMGEHKGELRQRILDLKYGRREDLARFFPKHISKYISKSKIDRFDYLLPVPSSPSSLKKRGYDSVRLMGEHLSELWELPLAIDILESLERRRQVGLKRAERFANVNGTFRLIDPSRVKGKNILVFDDVSASGATLNEVMKTLFTAAPQHLAALVLSKRLMR